MIDYKLFTRKTTTKSTLLHFREVPPMRLQMCYLVAVMLLKVSRINQFHLREGGLKFYPFRGQLLHFKIPATFAVQPTVVSVTNRNIIT
jgi:hypothetical protein